MSETTTSRTTAAGTADTGSSALTSSKKWVNWALLGAVVLIFLISLVVGNKMASNPDEAFGGTDDAATEAAEQAGADGLLAVTPYYSLPPQDMIVDHFVAIADATSLPVILYDIPHRTGRPIETGSLLELASHPRIRAVKDAKKDLDASSRVMAETDLQYYSGDDAITLPLMAIGGVGVVGTSTHFTGRRAHEMIDAFCRGDLAEALRLHRMLLPVFTGVFATQGCMMVKAGLAHQGMPVGACRPPLRSAPADLAGAFGELLDSTDL